MSTKQEFISQDALGHQPGPEEHDPCNEVLTSAAWVEACKRAEYNAICAATGTTFQPFALETTGGIYQGGVFLSTKHMRDLGLTADILEGKCRKHISFALRRGTIAHVTTALEVAERAAEDELALRPLARRVRLRVRLVGVVVPSSSSSSSPSRGHRGGASTADRSERLAARAPAA